MRWPANLVNVQNSVAVQQLGEYSTGEPSEKQGGTGNT